MPKARRTTVLKYNGAHAKSIADVVAVIGTAKRTHCLYVPRRAFDFESVQGKLFYCRYFDFAIICKKLTEL